MYEFVFYVYLSHTLYFGDYIQNNTDLGLFIERCQGYCKAKKTKYKNLTYIF